MVEENIRVEPLLLKVYGSIGSFLGPDRAETQEQGEIVRRLEVRYD